MGDNQRFEKHIEGFIRLNFEEILSVNFAEINIIIIWQCFWVAGKDIGFTRIRPFGFDGRKTNQFSML